MFAFFPLYIQQLHLVMSPERLRHLSLLQSTLTGWTTGEDNSLVYTMRTIHPQTQA